MGKIVFDGWIEIICGPMFSGKTEELIKKLDKVKYSKEKFIVFKPVIDTRSKNAIVSRHNKIIPAIEVQNSYEILDYMNNYQDQNYKVIAIDEVQFMDKNIVNVVANLAKQGYHLILAGLDKNFKAEPFGSMPELLAIADNVQKLIALCNVCGSQATFTYRTSNNDSEVLVGDGENYEARCYEHFSYKHND